MKIDGFQCDDCGKIHNYKSLNFGWLTVEEKLERDWVKFYHFCSIGCLSAWSLKRRMEEKTKHE